LVRLSYDASDRDRRLVQNCDSGADPTPDRRLRTFISSTLGELAYERQAARRAVEQLRLTADHVRAWRPSPPAPRAVTAPSRQSEVFVGIYWQRYGWVAPDLDITELEDEFILSDGMPRLVYVNRPAPEIEPRLERMLAWLPDEDSASHRPLPQPAELHHLLLDDLAVLLTERFGQGMSVECRSD
jgi:hypothetical protein